MGSSNINKNYPSQIGGGMDLIKGNSQQNPMAMGMVALARHKATGETSFNINPSQINPTNIAPVPQDNATGTEMGGMGLNQIPPVISEGVNPVQNTGVNTQVQPNLNPRVSKFAKGYRPFFRF